LTVGDEVEITMNQGRFYVGAGGQVRARAPRFTCCPRIQSQKLSNSSDVISEVSKCSKIQIFRGSAPDPAPQTPGPRSPEPLIDGEGGRCPCQESHPRTRPFRPRFYGSQNFLGRTAPVCTRSGLAVTLNSLRACGLDLESEKNNKVILISLLPDYENP